MVAKLNFTDVNSLIGDYRLLMDAELLQGALRLSAHVLTRDPDQFASQLVGRLLPYRNLDVIEQFVANTSALAPRPWLRPLHPALHPLGTGLVRTLQGHTGWVNSVAVTADGKRAVSASADKTGPGNRLAGSLELWDWRLARCCGPSKATFHLSNAWP
jgi:WD40 repeat protein